jgi:RNA polymerase sigma factor (sigma-70 family)
LPSRQPLRPLDVGDSALVRQEATATADRELDAQGAQDERDSTFRLLVQTIDELPSEDRLAIQLHYWSDMSIADISRTLGVAQKPLYRRLHRAMVKLLKRLEAAGVSRELVREIAAKPGF